ncbi:MAG: hypothetical protein HY078_10855 [Elusimicrobia bacterium]|nr:hypothetical protein [Elusimicrobiota bacterium]
MTRLLAVAASLSAALAQRAQACPVCFGASDGTSRLPMAYLVGTLVLVGSVFSMLAGLVYFVYQIESARKDDLVVPAAEPAAERLS